VQFNDGGYQGRSEDRTGIENHPHASAAPGSTLMARRSALVPLLGRGRRGRGYSLPKFGCRHICFEGLKNV
jgi:hypothetical protein